MRNLCFAIIFSAQLETERSLDIRFVSRDPLLTTFSLESGIYAKRNAGRTPQFRVFFIFF